jgi:hypothetical protein
MILKNRLHNLNALIAAGQLCLVIGIFAQRVLHPSTDFWQGFVAGLSSVLIGLSIVFNLRGLVLWRNQRG